MLTKEEKKYYKAIFIRDRKVFFGMYMVQILQVGIAALQPILMMKLINDALAGDRIKNIILYSILFFLLLLFGALFNLLYQRIAIKWRMNYEMIEREKIIKHFIYQTELNPNAGDIDTILKRDVEEMSSYIRFIFSDLPGNIVRGIILFIIIFFVDYRLSIIIVCINLLIVFAQKKTNKILVKNGEEVRNLYTELYGDLTEISVNSASVYEIKADNYLIQKHKAIFNILSKKVIKKIVDYNRISSFLDVANSASLVVLLLSGSIMISAGILSVGVLVSFIQYTNQVLSVMNNLMQYPLERANRRAVISKIIPFSTEEEDKETYTPNFKNNSIEFRKVSFGYSDGDEIFTEMSCLFEKGKINVIYGLSGEGKSTLFKLILKRYRKYEGSVTVGGININELTKDNIIDYVGYMPQNDIIFKDSIKENINLGRFESEDIIVKACKSCGIYEEISKMTNGIDTILNPENLNVSGGQIKRILLARLLLGNCEILLLDEPTAALDKENKEKILKVLEQLAKEKNIILITHDNEIKIRADRIYRLENKRLVMEKSDMVS